MLTTIVLGTDLDHRLGTKYLDIPGHNPGPGSQNTAKLAFVLLVSAGKKTRAQKVMLQGRVPHDGITGSVKVVCELFWTIETGRGRIRICVLVGNGICASLPAANSEGSPSPWGRLVCSNQVELRDYCTSEIRLSP